jgi:enoyl-CoA hydratase/carnithine racemase
MTETAPGPARLTIETVDHVRWIILDNPARLNALTAAMWEALPDAIDAAVTDPDVRVIVVTGAGHKAFSAGADISEFDTQRTGDAARRYDDLNTRAFEALARSAKPTIAMIEGFCLGGGLEVALCCDLRYASDTAQFGIPAARLGIGYNPRWVRPMLAGMTAARAKEVLFTGRRFTAAESLTMGIVNRVVPSDRLDAETRALAADIAANAPLSVYAAKRTIDEFQDRPENPDMATLDEHVRRCFESADYAEGRRAFLEKRKPRFEGR